MKITQNYQPRQINFSKVILYRIPFFIFVFLFTAVSLFFIAKKPGIKFNPDLRSLIPVSSANEKLDKERVNSEYLVIAIEKAIDGPELFSQTVLYDIQRAMKKIEETANVKIAISPFEQFQIVATTNSDRSVKTFTPTLLLKKSFTQEVDYPIAPHQCETFKQQLLSNPLTKRLVINDEGTMLAFMVDHTKLTHTSKLPDTISEILNSYSNSFSYTMAGTAFFEKYVSEFLVKDLITLLSLSLFVCLVFFFFCFRSIKGMILPLITVLLGTIWMLGTMSLFGIEITVVSLVCPPLILSLGSSYCIHMLSQYYRFCGDDNKSINPQKVLEGTSKINPTILMATTTTIIALLGLLATKTVQTHYFAISTILGLFYSAFLSIIFLPFILTFLPLPSLQKSKKTYAGFLASALEKLGDIIVTYRYLFLFLLILILLSPLVFFRFMKYESDYVGYFNDETPAVVQTSKISRNLSGTTQLYIDYQINHEKLVNWLQEQNIPLSDISNYETFYHNYDLTQSILEFEKVLQKDKNIRYIISFPLLLAEVNKSIYNQYEIPSSLTQRLKLDSIFKFLKIRNSTQYALINSSADRIATIFRVADLKNSHGYFKEDDLRVFVRDLQNQLSTFLPPYIDFQLDGHRIDFFKLRAQLDSDLNRSTILSILLIFLTVSLLFRSGWYGLYALIPMLTGISLNFTIMALAGIPMDMTTIMVSCVAIGIGVDDSIHFLLHYSSNIQKENTSWDEIKAALVQTLIYTGRPIIMTSISIICGLGMLLFAQFKPISYFGFLIIIALLSTTIATLIFLPVIIYLHGKIASRFKRPTVSS